MRYIWRPVQKLHPQQQQQQQQTQHEQQEDLDIDLNKLMSTIVQMQSMELQDHVMQRTTTTYASGPNAAAATSVREIIPPHHLRRMMSFLEKDDSFLTPWGWDSFAHQSGTASFFIRGNRNHRFQPGSFFDREYLENFLRCRRYGSSFVS